MWVLYYKTVLALIIMMNKLSLRKGIIIRKYFVSEDLNRKD